MKFCFNNSYQQSFVGYQLSTIESGSNELHQIDYSGIPDTVRSSMMNSGTEQIIYRDKDGTYVMCMRRLTVSSPRDGRQWYINFAVTAREKEFDQFSRFAAKCLQDPVGFLKELAWWFEAEPEKILSYSLDTQRFNRYVCSGLSQRRQNGRSFMVPGIGGILYQHALRCLNQRWKRGCIYLLVTEADREYFKKQNPVFDGMSSRYVFGSGGRLDDRMTLSYGLMAGLAVIGVIVIIAGLFRKEQV
ncbi:MAG: hypothetical protein LUK37_02390 [Clostridia bacterium]|nr:hypothetical protein [Clostridia bacterium]